MIRIDGVLVSPGPGGVYNEKMLQAHRIWDPYRSKLAAYAEMNPSFDLTDRMRILYLGAAHGTTVSHVADYVETVYAVEFAPRPMQDLLTVSRSRKTIVPIMGDARHPEGYAPFVEAVDMIYQDVAQPDQAAIALKNLPFLKEEGELLLMLKTRSVDIRKSPEEVAGETARILREGGLTFDTPRPLEPYHADHVAFLCRRKGGFSAE